MKEICSQIVQKLKENDKTLAFMESCTGGFLANELTNISGASNVLKVSAVTYSNEYKQKLGVDKAVIDKYTVYSIQTATEMAKAVAEFANSNIGVGVTGELGNTVSRENKVYYTIYNRERAEYINKEIVAIGDKRTDMKKDVAKRIFTDILGGI